jgi:chromosome partitioning protein
VDHRRDVLSVYDVLLGEATIAEVAVPVADVPNLKCVPATIDLAGAEIDLVSMEHRETRLARAIAAAELDDVDYVFIDCPPSLGLLTVNALTAADEVLVPVQCEYYALEGLTQLLQTIELVRSRLNPQLEVSTILLTMYDGRTRLAEQVAQEVRRHFGPKVLRTTIPRSVRVSEAPSHGQTVLTYDPGSPGALSYLEAGRELARAVDEPAVTPPR